MTTIYLGEGEKVTVRLYELIDEQKTPFSLTVQKGKLHINFGFGELLPLDNIYRYYREVTRGEKR
jgi:hypothetical protein